MLGRIRNGLAGIGLLTIGGLTIQTVSSSEKSRREKKIPERSLIHIDLSVPLVETQPPPLAQLFSPRKPITLRSLIDSIRKASTDNRVKGILCTFGGSEPNLATAQELRNAILDFRKAQSALPAADKKFAWVAADTFGNCF